MRRRLAARMLRACLAGMAAACALATSQAADPAEARARLDDLKKRIEALREQLGEAEASRSEVSDRLRETERAISRAGARLRELAQRREQAEAALAELERQSQDTSRRIEAGQLALGRLLNRHYRAGPTDQLRLILGGADPNQVARDYHFLTLLSRAQAELIAQLRAALRDKRELARRAHDRREELARIEQAQRSERDALVATKDERRRVLAQVSGKIRGQRREIATLKRNERRLTRLIEGLGRILTRPLAPGRPGGPRRGAPAIRNEALPDASLAGGSFESLKGKLRLPVRGELVTRFGSPTGESGGTAKGLFIRTGNGEEIRAIAGGRVVFADWLRGFGNLLIVEHAGGYLSVYGNNETLLKGVGDAVAAGDVIAAAGASGGGEQSGLYFELRHRGQPIDPMKWVTLR